MTDEQNIMPVVPLRDIVIFPHMVIPLFVGRAKSIQALTTAMNVGKQIFVVAQKKSKVKDPTIHDMHNFGTVANVLQLLKLPDGTVKVLVEGMRRGRIEEFIEEDEMFLAVIEQMDDVWDAKDPELSGLLRAATDLFEDYVKANSKIPEEVLSAITGIKEPGRVADTIAMHLPLKINEAQKVLEVHDGKKRLEVLLKYLQAEIDVSHMEERIHTRVRSQMEKGQREYYLHEKLKAIKEELGEKGDKERVVDELEKLKKLIKKSGMNKDAEDKALAELKKLQMMPTMSPEASILRNYIDWLVDLPWKKCSRINKDLPKAQGILEDDHYGLDKIKERILEYLAVQQRVKKVKGPILCLVGPPGVGKTSLGQSIARATGREFIRVALGGVRDEAEIRGHRRTYIGSMPGKVLQKMAKAKVCNPLFMLDEVDKMSMDFRGDPSSALLEVLDPEQNHAFADHYLEVDYDLSDVMFVCTANTLDIPSPLLDRMELLFLDGYTEDEKLHIAKKYLVPKQIKEAGLKDKELVFSDEAILEIIRYYTREAGVRSLEREIAKVCRKIVKGVLLKKIKTTNTKITPKSVEKYLGVRQHRFGLAEQQDQVGQVTGLAWTEVGGDLLTIEVAIIPGKGGATYTGSLGDVMLESIQAAITVVRSRIDKLGIPKDFYTKTDIHVHVPEGAIPKDGPSAGVGMCVALVSALTKIPVRADVAMTGEITLRGELLPIGGLKEKLLAALRGGIKTVIIPEENVKDLKEIPKNITDNLELKPVKWIDEALTIALAGKLKPLPAKNVKNTKPIKKAK
ncbi:MAG: endopeptidase La [Gammaproteobacteria bacterium]|nr:endopeptidase La [Gammaproteobacteria bacterium]